MERQTIVIDESKCDGCGACARACAEGVIKIIDGVARLVNEDHCDGLGACIGDCPNGAISLVTVAHEPIPGQITDDGPATERVAASADTSGPDASGPDACADEPGRRQTRGCPLWSISLDHIGADSRANGVAEPSAPTPSASRGGGTTPGVSRAVPNWPIQISLVSPTAKWLVGADLLVCADCVAYACPDFHSRLLPSKTLLVGCPKFDDRERFVSRLSEILSVAQVRSIEALHMDVACCSGLERLVEQAQKTAGTQVPMAATVVGVDGRVL
jgi:NAD-dependent dihydropyrimidine dehydrogenase PreA subunit